MPGVFWPSTRCFPSRIAISRARVRNWAGPMLQFRRTKNCFSSIRPILRRCTSAWRGSFARPEIRRRSGTCCRHWKKRPDFAKRTGCCWRLKPEHRAQRKAGPPSRRRTSHEEAVAVPSDFPVSCRIMHGAALEGRLGRRREILSGIRNLPYRAGSALAQHASRQLDECSWLREGRIHFRANPAGRGPLRLLFGGNLVDGFSGQRLESLVSNPANDLAEGGPERTRAGPD